MGNGLFPHEEHESAHALLAPSQPKKLLLDPKHNRGRMALPPGESCSAHFTEEETEAQGGEGTGANPA